MTYHFSAVTSLRLGYRDTKTSSLFMPGGGNAGRRKRALSLASSTELECSCLCAARTLVASRPASHGAARRYRKPAIDFYSAFKTGWQQRSVISKLGENIADL